MTNVTIAVPAGSTLYGNQLCSPPSWTDLLTFYLANYVTHLGTIQLYPGEHGVNKWLVLVTALFLPVAGLGKGLDRMIRCARFGKTKLEKAARAGALCMVVRSPSWRPCPTDTLLDLASGTMPLTDPSEQKAFQTVTGVSFFGILKSQLFFDDGKSSVGLAYHEGRAKTARTVRCNVYDPSWQIEGRNWWSFLGVGTGRIEVTRKFYGSVQHKVDDALRDGLPDGYTLAYVPHDANVDSLTPESPSVTASSRESKGFVAEDNVSGSSDSLSILSAVVQLLFSATTLYNAVGPQINHFGFAAYGLTVFPYSLMSLVNLLAALVCPAYELVYMVESEVMHEAIARGAIVRGTVGSVRAEHHSELISSRETILRSLTLAEDDCPQEEMAATKVENEPMVVACEEKRTDHTTIETSSSTDSDADTTQKTNIKVYCEPRQAQIAVLTMSACLAKVFPNVQYSSWLTRKTSQLWVSFLQDDYGDEQPQDQILVPSHPAIMRYKGPGSGSRVFAVLRTLLICAVVGYIPLIPVGLLSGFRPQSSTMAQRVITMLWFATGVSYGASFAWMEIDTRELLLVYNTLKAEGGPRSKLPRYGMCSKAFYIALLCPFAVPGIAGLVVAGLMFVSFGTCTTVA